MYHTPQWYAELRDVGMLWQSLGGVLLFLGSLPKRRHAWLRILLFWFLGGALFYTARVRGLLFLEHGSNVYLVYLLCLLTVYASCRVSVWTAWMVGSAGFLAQQLCGNLLLAFRTVPAVASCFDYSSRIVLADVVFYLSIYLVLWRIFRGNFTEEEEAVKEGGRGTGPEERLVSSLPPRGNRASLPKVMFCLMAMLFSLGFYTMNQYVTGWQNFSQAELMTNALYVSVGGIFLFALQYGLLRQQRTDAELAVYETLLYAQKKQWEESREHTALVNEKYHDMKKLLHSLRGEVNSQVMHTIRDAIEAYDDHVSTGHQVLDVVLTQAREVCRLHGIQFTCFVNGQDFAPLEDMDIYSLFKNALDNAVEAVCALPEGRDRFISLLARREGDLLFLHMENPCGEVVFAEGLPKTSKDPDYHGFGMRSMSRTAAKYGGTLTCAVAEEVFFLDSVLFPYHGKAGEGLPA